jgi:hypothetical protein
MFEIDSFYLIVLSVATIILILVLGFMGWMLSHQKDEIKFPQVTISCPDFWDLSANNECIQPASGKFNRGADDSLTKYRALGSATNADVPGVVSSNGNKIGFESSDAGWGTGSSATCNKRKWANDNGILWDSVTNVNFC